MMGYSRTGDIVYKLQRTGFRNILETYDEWCSLQVHPTCTPSRAFVGHGREINFNILQVAVFFSVILHRITTINRGSRSDFHYLSIYSILKISIY